MLFYLFFGNPTAFGLPGAPMLSQMLDFSCIHAMRALGRLHVSSLCLAISLSHSFAVSVCTCIITLTQVVSPPAAAAAANDLLLRKNKILDTKDAKK